jgi:hypothetical protein
MAQERDSPAFRFAVVLALSVTVLMVTTWTAPPHLANDTAKPIPHSDAIYRARSAGPAQITRLISISGEDRHGKRLSARDAGKEPGTASAPKRSLRTGPHLHFDLLGGPIIKISAAERPNFVLGHLIICGIAIFILALVALTL